MSRAPGARDDIDRAVGHHFADPSLLHEALTHASASGQGVRPKRSNERLEFLGDRVLGLVVAHMLISRYPEDPEGALSRRHAALVCRDMLATVATELELGDRLTVARSEEDGGGRRNPAILADTCEAVIGAIFLDGGLEPAQHFIRRHWSEHLDAMRRPPRDAKTALQEWAQARGHPLPVYETENVEGPAHAPRFRVSVKVGDFHHVSAEERSKRAAEMAAADAMLHHIPDNGDD